MEGVTAGAGLDLQGVMAEALAAAGEEDGEVTDGDAVPDGVVDMAEVTDGATAILLPTQPLQGVPGGEELAGIPLRDLSSSQGVTRKRL